MPITKSAMKRVRSDERKKLRNQKIRTELKTLFKKIVSLTAHDPAKAKEEASILASKLGRAARKGIIPKRRADRKKSRLALLLNKIHV